MQLLEVWEMPMGVLDGGDLFGKSMWQTPWIPFREKDLH